MGRSEVPVLLACLIRLLCWMCCVVSMAVLSFPVKPIASEPLVSLGGCHSHSPAAEFDEHACCCGDLWVLGRGLSFLETRLSVRCSTSAWRWRGRLFKRSCWCRQVSGLRISVLAGVTRFPQLLAAAFHLLLECSVHARSRSPEHITDTHQWSSPPDGGALASLSHDS